MTHVSDTFPDPVYRDTVLAPLFDGARTGHAHALRQVDKAHLVMLAETGILTPAQAGAIAGGLRAVWAETDPAAMRYAGDVEDFFFAMEKALKARIGPDLGGRLHTARSRNDIDHTLFRLALKPRVEAALAEGRAALAQLLATAGREAETLIVAYTHGQPAQPTTLGHYLAAVAEVMLRDLARLEAALEIVDRCPLGAAAITTTGFPTDRHRVAQLLGFAAPLQNSYGCIATVDYISATYSALSLLFLHLGRPVQDLQFWSSFEVGQIRLPGGLVQISSIMPQKRNPVAIEHLRHLASQTWARSNAVLDILHNTPFTDMNDSEGETQDFGHQAFDAALRSLRLFGRVMAALQVDGARVARNLRLSCATVTELADMLVREAGLSFRAAHEIASEVAGAVVAAGEDLSSGGYPHFRRAYQAATGQAPEMDAAAFAQATSAAHFVALRDRFGGPAPAALQPALAGYGAELQALEDRAAVRAAQARAAAEALEQSFNQLSGGA